jgi:hypothetical protein
MEAGRNAWLDLKIPVPLFDVYNNFEWVMMKIV